MVQLDGSEELNWNETIGYFTASFGIEKEEAADEGVRTDPHADDRGVLDGARVWVI